MRHVSVEELRQMASDCRESIWAQAQAIGREPKIYLHWTVGHYGQFWDDYHVQIDEDGEIYVYGELDEILAHTWRRNTGAICVTLLCGYLASANGDLALSLRRQHKLKVWLSLLKLWLTACGSLLAKSMLLLMVKLQTTNATTGVTKTTACAQLVSAGIRSICRLIKVLHLIHGKKTVPVAATSYVAKLTGITTSVANRRVAE